MIFKNALPVACSYSFVVYRSAVVDPKERESDFKKTIYAWLEGLKESVYYQYWEWIPNTEFLNEKLIVHIIKYI